MNKRNKILLLSLTLLIVIGLQAISATDNNTIIQDDNTIDNSNIIQTQEQSQITDNDIYSEDSNTDENHEYESRYDKLIKNDNLTKKNDEDGSYLHFSDFSNIVVCKNEDGLDFGPSVYYSYDITIDGHTTHYDEEIYEGRIKCYLEGEFVAQDGLPSMLYVPTGNLDYGEHEIRLVYEDDSGSYPSIETTFSFIKTEAIRPEIKLGDYSRILSTIEDNNITIPYQIIDNYAGYKQVNTGNIEIYFEKENREYYLYKTLNISDNIYLTLDELYNSYSYKFGNSTLINMHIGYVGDNTTYVNSRMWGLQFFIYDNKKSFINYEKYETSDEGTKIFFKTTDSQDNIISKGNISGNVVLYDQNYNMILSDSGSTIDNNYILLNDLNLNDYLGYYLDLSYYYNDETGEYADSSGNTRIEIVIPLTFNVAEHLYTKFESFAYFTFNLTDENDTIINLDGYINVYYPKDDVWIQTIYTLKILQ